MTQLRWGICSAGLICHDFADVLISLPADEHKIEAIAARELDRAKKFAEQFEIPKAYDSYTTLANDPQVDIVYVGAAQSVHYELSKLFLTAGKHVVCEKAVTCAAWQVEELVALSREKKVFFMEGMWSRCFPLYQTIRDIIASDELGKVRYLEVRFKLNLTQSPAASRLKEELGGGVMWDIGVYALQFADWVMGEQPLSVNAVGSLFENGVDESVCVTLQYTGGRFACLTLSLGSVRETVAIVQGSAGKLVVEEPFHAPRTLTITPINGEARVVEGAPLPSVKYPTKYRNSAGLVYEARHVRECLNHGLTESPLIPHSLSIWMQRTIDFCFRQIGRQHLPKPNDAAKP